MITRFKNWLRTAAGLLLAISAVPVAGTCGDAKVASPPVVSSADDYIIGPGDGLEVVVSGLPELSRSVIVRPDGKISTPDVEDMVADRKSPSRLARDIEIKLGEEGVRNPKVTVIVANAVSNSSQVKVMGEVKEQKAIPYREGLKVSDLIIAAGGLTDFAAGNGAHISRKVGGREVKIDVRLKDVLRGKKQDTDLLPGDVLFVPMSRW